MNLNKFSSSFLPLPCCEILLYVYRGNHSQRVEGEDERDEEQHDNKKRSEEKLNFALVKDEQQFRDKFDKGIHTLCFAYTQMNAKRHRNYVVESEGA